MSWLVLYPAKVEQFLKTRAPAPREIELPVLQTPWDEELSSKKLVLARYSECWKRGKERETDKAAVASNGLAPRPAAEDEEANLSLRKVQKKGQRATAEPPPCYLTSLCMCAPTRESRTEASG
jgi:hypothetical protein